MINLFLACILISIGLVACNTNKEAFTLPTAYQSIIPPDADFFTQSTTLQAGEQLYQHHCATCHGETGHGDGPAGHTLPLKPANLTDPLGVANKPLNYWFWRVSEGGTVEPFHSAGSVMPAWKYHLSETERWEVIAFGRSLN